jgi:cell division septation protein DedD
VLKFSLVSSESRDDGFHEIQLNGKQLVFLFMAATVVSVVIFLCGVLVGRGVRVERTAVSEEATLAEPPAADPALPSTAPAPATVAADPRAAAPPTATEDLSYFNRLERSNQPVEDLKPAAKSPAPDAKAGTEKAAERGKTVAAVPPKEPAPPKDKEAPAAAAAPPGSGYAVQVAALNVRSEADAIAKKLASKGYAAYVQTPSDGTPSVYRVRIGTFKTRREAETVAARLQKEEQYKPWVTR